MKNRLLTFFIIFLLVAGISGLTASTLFTLLEVGVKPDVKVGAVHISMVTMLFVVLIVEIVSAIKIDDSTFHTAILAGCVFALYFFSADTYLFLEDVEISVAKEFLGIASETVYVFMSVCCYWYVCFLYDLSFNRKMMLGITVPVISVLLVGYMTSIFYGFGYIAHFITFAFLSSTFFTVLYSAAKKNKIGVTTYFTVALFCLGAGVQNVNALFYSGVNVGVPGITLVYAVMTIAMFLCVYLMFSIRTDSKAVLSTEYKHQAELFETKALTGQIKPHFIFNSLEAVRTLYHKEIAAGDAAVNHLSDFLRGTISAFDSELIPFETEIDNVFSYTEFENLKRENKIDVIFNIDFTDFFVPPFSVQPFVENAVKYSGVDEIENGSIIISSYKKGNCAVIEITDNGKGFDTSAVSESSHGIKNVNGRFALTLGTVPQIVSKIGEGTHIKIEIDLTKQKEHRDENSRSRR